MASGLARGTLPPFIGIRIKPFSEELFARSARTLDIFVRALVQKAQGKLPHGLVVTLPKVVHPTQVATLAGILGSLETKLRLAKGALKIELMVETPQSIFNKKGEVALPSLVAAAKGRCTGAHFGTYDYTALCGITAAHQTMAHPACDFAKHVMQVSLAQTGVMLSDGATNLMPYPHKGALSPDQREENRRVVHKAWRWPTSTSGTRSAAVSIRVDRTRRSSRWLRGRALLPRGAGGRFQAQESGEGGRPRPGRRVRRRGHGPGPPELLPPRMIRGVTEDEARATGLAG